MDLPTDILERLTAAGASAAEVEERFIRGSGPGGQKINKTSSTVVLRHRPTGLEVRIQAERSQTANRRLAWEQLAAKLAERARAARQAAVDARETERRRTRQKSYGQKRVMIESKFKRAKVKRSRRHVDWAE